MLQMQLQCHSIACSVVGMKCVVPMRAVESEKEQCYVMSSCVDGLSALACCSASRQTRHMGQFSPCAQTLQIITYQTMATCLTQQYAQGLCHDFVPDDQTPCTKP